MSVSQNSQRRISRRHFDYRLEVPQASAVGRRASANDVSVLTMGGTHKVAHTLIRAYFSPQHTTGQRFVITGCARGKAVGELYHPIAPSLYSVYDILTGELVGQYAGHKGPVRDVAWHPTQNEIVTVGVSCVVLACQNSAPCSGTASATRGATIRSFATARKSAHGEVGRPISCCRTPSAANVIHKSTNEAICNGDRAARAILYR